MILKNIKWQTSEKLIRLSLSLLISIFVMRMLGPANYSSVMGALAIFYLFFGFIPSVFKSEFINNHINRKIDPLNLVVDLYLIWLVLVVVLIFGYCSAFITISYTDLLIIILASAFAPLSYLRFIFEANNEFDILFKIEVSGFVIINVFKVVLVYLNSSSSLILMTFVFEFYIIALLSLIFVHKQKLNIAGRLRAAIYSLGARSQIELKPLLPLIVVGCITMLYTKMDQVLITDMFSKDEAGKYFSAIRFFEMGLVVMLVILNSYYPKLSKLYAEGDAQGFNELAGHVYYLSIGLAVIMILGAQFFVPLLFKSLLGPAYNGTGIILTKLTYLYLPLFLGQTWGAIMLVKKNRQKFLLAHALCAVFVVLSLVSFSYNPKIDNLPYYLLIAYGASVLVNFIISGLTTEINQFCQGGRYILYQVRKKKL